MTLMAVFSWVTLIVGIGSIIVGRLSLKEDTKRGLFLGLLKLGYF